MPAARPPPRDRYHHGDLRRTLIDAAEALLAERGADAFSLREVARRAGVSPAAPAHHFEDAAGLLTAVATQGFEALAEALSNGRDSGGADPRARLLGQGVGYVRFALAQPGKFRLLFRRGQLHDDPALHAAAGTSYAVLEDGIREIRGIAPGGELDAAARAALVAMWSVVHGYAHLAIAGRFDALAAPKTVEEWTRTTLPAVLAGAIAGIASDGPASAPGSMPQSGPPDGSRDASPCRPAAQRRPPRR